ncbi:hypothetical protein COLO4_04722 [Corchorus olitorius]|uniref:Uncharacterized protein n=1 Tax=Corchorus olitorius TaxID=93759 RepID=A0A1R3KSY1_9ROSI|nr:hypothetical protein COLO4_04722 [Corchorus olitorius]
MSLSVRRMENGRDDGEREAVNFPFYSMHPPSPLLALTKFLSLCAGLLGKRIRISRSRWQNELAILLSSCIVENFAAMVSSFDLAPNILMHCH